MNEERYKDGNAGEDHAWDPIENPLRNPVQESLTDPIKTLPVDPLGEPLKDFMQALNEQSAAQDTDFLGQWDIVSDDLQSAVETPKSIASVTASFLSDSEAKKKAESTKDQETKKKDAKPKSSKTGGVANRASSNSSKQIKKSGKTSARKKIIGSVFSRAGSTVSKKSKKSGKTSKQKKKTGGDSDMFSVTSRASSNASVKSTKSSRRSSVTSLQFGSMNKNRRWSNVSSPGTPQSRTISRRSSRTSIASRTFRLHTSRQSGPVELKKLNTNQLIRSLRMAKKRAAKEAEMKPKPIFHDILHSDEGSLTEFEDKQSEVIEEEQNIMRINILEHLKEIPDVNDLSERSSDPAQVESVDGTDKGHFVPPRYESSTGGLSLKFKAMSAEGEPEEESRFEGASTTSSSVQVTLDSFSDSDDELFAVKTNIDPDYEEAEDVANKLIKISIRDNQMHVFDPTGDDSVAQRRALEETCELLLDELIQHVMVHSEEYPWRLLRFLDKEKLMNELILLFHQHDEENSIRHMLSQSVTEHFFRKRQFVFIKKETHFDALNYQRFQSSLIELDRLLEIQTRTVERVQNQIITLTEEYNRSQNFFEQKARDFEEIVRKTLLINDNFLHLPDVVDHMFKSMSRFRNELSELRLELLHIQHRFAEMKNRSEKLEDLGEGLKMQDYISMQTHTHVLLSKIADRDVDLNRLHTKLNYDLHALAHLKGKEQMCLKSLEAMKAKLKECETLRSHYRDLIYQGKLKHNKFLRELHRMRTSGTLIFYPTLMIDYDQTAELLENKRAAVGKLRLEHKRLTDRIAKMELELAAKKRSDKSSRSFIIRNNILPGLSVTQLQP